MNTLTQTLSCSPTHENKFPCVLLSENQASDCLQQLGDGCGHRLLLAGTLRGTLKDLIGAAVSGRICRVSWNCRLLVPLEVSSCYQGGFLLLPQDAGGPGHSFNKNQINKAELRSCGVAAAAAGLLHLSPSPPGLAAGRDPAKPPLLLGFPLTFHPGPVCSGPAWLPLTARK